MCNVLSFTQVSGGELLPQKEALRFFLTSFAVKAHLEFGKDYYSLPGL